MLGRRPILAGLALAMVGGGAAHGQAPIRAAPVGPYGMIGRLRAVAGRRADLLAALSMGSSTMPGCLQYVVCEDIADADSLWVVEFWDSKASHDVSLQLPQVREAIRIGRPLIAGFDTSAEVRPVAGLPSG